MGYQTVSRWSLHHYTINHTPNGTNKCTIKCHGVFNPGTWTDVDVPVDSGRRKPIRRRFVCPHVYTCTKIITLRGFLKFLVVLGRKKTFFFLIKTNGPCVFKIDHICYWKGSQTHFIYLFLCNIYYHTEWYVSDTMKRYLLCMGSYYTQWKKSVVGGRLSQILMMANFTKKKLSFTSKNK